MGPRAPFLCNGRPARRLAVLLIAGVALISIVGFLLVLNYRSASTVRDYLLRQHVQRVQLHASALGHLLSAAQKDVRNLAESREVAAFYENRDLGMSMQYGLALSLVPIHERLRGLVEPSQAADDGALVRVALLDGDGNALADSGDAGAPPITSDVAQPTRDGVSLSPDGRHLVLSLAHQFKGRPVGRFVAWLRPATVLGTLAETGRGVHFSFVIVDENRRPYRPDGDADGAPWFVDGIGGVPDDGAIVKLQPSPKQRSGEGFVAIRVPVPGYSFSVLNVERESDLVGGVSPASSVAILTTAAIAILAAVLLSFFLGTKSLLLETRLQESLLREHQVAEQHAALQREIAERRRLEAAHQLLAAAVEQSAEAIAVTDSAGHIEYVNPALERATGFSAADLHGRSLLSLSEAAQDETLSEEVRSALTSDVPWKGELKIRHQRGSSFDAEVGLSAIRREGKVVHLLLIGRDVTEEKRLREQLRHRQKLEAVGTLAGGVAHDFNNVLTAISGYATLALEALEESHPARGEVLGIQRAGSRAADLTRQLLAFSRRQVLKPRVVELEAEIAEVQKLLRRVIGEHVQLVVTTRCERPWRVRVDPGQFEQVLMNLVVNARDAMPGGGTVTISLGNVVLSDVEARGYPDAIPGSYASVTVSDTGTGMDEETLGHVFEPFFTTKGQGKGTGLGLSIVYGIVRQSRGFIAVRSRKGSGTTFEILLPRETAEVERKPPVSTAGTGGAQPSRAQTILVAEDEPMVREVLTSQLRSERYTVLAAADGREALAMAERHAGRIDLLLSDVRMPHMDGPELARALLLKFPDTRVVFMSGYAEEAVAHDGELACAAAFVQKPWSFPDLTATLRRVLDEPSVGVKAA